MRQVCGDHFSLIVFFGLRDEFATNTHARIRTFIMAFNVEIPLSINGAFACYKWNRFTRCERLIRNILFSWMRYFEEVFWSFASCSELCNLLFIFVMMVPQQHGHNSNTKSFASMRIVWMKNWKTFQVHRTCLLRNWTLASIVFSVAHSIQFNNVSALTNCAIPTLGNVLIIHRRSCIITKMFFR